MQRSAALLVVLAALSSPVAASAYCWPLTPFHKAHPIRGAFGDPRYHAGLEGQVSAFHFGVDITAADGTPVYAVEAGYVHARSADVAVESGSGRVFGYWHIRPVVRTGQHVRLHQLLGYVGHGWGHLHLAESFHGAYKDPLRPGALTPFHDRIAPTVESIELLSPESGSVPLDDVTGPVDLIASVYELPPVAPPVPWQVAHLTPAVVWWTLDGPNGFFESDLVVDFEVGLPPNSLYSWVYESSSYQNKPNRSGRYLFWLAHGLDTADLPDGHYQLTVWAENPRGKIGNGTLDFVTANGVNAAQARTRRPVPGVAQPD